MATQKTPVKKATRKTTAVKRVHPNSSRSAPPEPTYAPHFKSVEERLAYIYGSMTPEDDVRTLYQAGILTPSGRLSSKFK